MNLVTRHGTYARRVAILSILVLLAFTVLLAKGTPVVLAATITVDGTGDGSLAALAGNGTCDLREAIQSANTDTAVDSCTSGTAGADTIVFAVSTNGTPITLTGTLGDDANVSGDLDITDALTITGNGAANTIIEAGTTTTNGVDRVFDVHGTTVTFEDVTIRHGLTLASFLPIVSNIGGGIAARAPNGLSSVTVTDSIVTDNTATGANGGGIHIGKPLFASNPTLTITGSTISDNTADLGGGVHCLNCTLIVDDTTVSGNTATVTGGGGFGGGGISATGFDVDVDIFGGSIITDNDSGEDGGGILFGGGTSGLMTIDDSTISDNRADENGGGIADELTLAGVGMIMVTNTTIVDNTANFDAAAPGGVGGGISISTATMHINLSRITGNSADAGTGIANSSGTVNAEDNWWGCDAFPGTPLCDDTSGIVDSDPRLDLRLSAVPGAVPVSGSSTLTADLSLNSDGVAVDDSVLLGLTITFDGGPLGTVSPATDTISSSASTTFIGVMAGSDFVKATLDNAPGQTAPIIVGPGTIIISKVTVPAGGAGFDFSQNIDASGNFMLNHGGTATFNIVPTGSYIVTETDPTAAGFSLTTLSCDDGGSTTPSGTNLGTRTATIELDPGETVTCTFTNEPLGGVDTTAPRCEVIGVIPASSPPRLEVEVQDTGSGTAAINVLILQNSTVNIPGFAPGTTSVLTIFADKINLSQSSRLEIEAFDVAGNRSTCDPLLISAAPGQRGLTRTTIDSVPHVDRYLTLYSSDARPALLLVTVNGRWLALLGGTRTIDLGSALNEGQDNNITLRGWGAIESIMISDVVPSNANLKEAGPVRRQWPAPSAWNIDLYGY